MSRCRTYAPVAKRWAEYNETGEGRNQRKIKSLSFCNNILYSYSTPVAVYQTSSTGLKYVLMTSRRWSLTTTAHLNMARGYVNVPLFRTEWIGAHQGIWKPMKDVHASNLLQMFDRLENVKAEEMKRWKSPDDWQFSVNRAYEDIILYAKLTGHPLPENFWPQHAHIDQVAAERLRRMKAYENPKAVERRRRVAARKEAYRALDIE